MNVDPTLPLIECYYVIKDILGKREANGRVEYLVEWTNTWEPDHRVYCPTLVAKFENRIREEARMLELIRQRGGIAHVDEAQASVGGERQFREHAQRSAQTTNIPEGAGEPEKFIDIIFRNGMYYFVMLWKGNNQVTLVPFGTANIVYPALVHKYLTATDSD